MLGRNFTFGPENPGGEETETLFHRLSWKDTSCLFLRIHLQYEAGEKGEIKGTWEEKEPLSPDTGYSFL